MRDRRTLLLPLLLLTLGADCSSVKRWAYEGGDRDEWQRPDAVVAELALAPGARVADVGSGSGYFTLPFARAVAPDGRVFAVDVDAEMNAHLTSRLAEAGVGNVEVVLATADDPGLPPAGIDLVFMSNTYHHIQDRTTYVAKLARALRSGGRIAIIEYDDARAGWFVRTFGHNTPRDTIVSELEAAGYRLLAEPDFLPRQNFLIFEPAR
jgi:ubiquinone/menaquinone biosynthesis C-methylase UbiE